MTLASGKLYIFLCANITKVVFGNHHLEIFINLMLFFCFLTGDDEGIESDQYDTEVEEAHSLDHKNRY